MVYKNIHAVMAARAGPVDVLGQFDPKLVKMCPAGNRAGASLISRHAAHLQPVGCFGYYWVI